MAKYKVNKQLSADLETKRCSEHIWVPLQVSFYIHLFCYHHRFKVFTTVVASDHSDHRLPQKAHKSSCSYSFKTASHSCRRTPVACTFSIQYTLDNVPLADLSTGMTWCSRGRGGRGGQRVVAQRSPRKRKDSLLAKEQRPHVLTTVWVDILTINC